MLVASLPFTVSPAAAQDAALAKIDPPLLPVLDAGGTARVIVLGRTQLFAPVGGLEEFEREHAGEDRLALRRQVVATLKRNAETEQARILRALGRERAGRALWILNALSLELGADEIRAASRLDDVLFIYAGGELLPSEPRSPRASIVVTPQDEPRDFTLTGKRVAWNVRHLDAPRAWTELGSLGEGAVVAVLDNGVNHVHTDLRANLWRNAGEIPNNGVDDDHNGWVDDLYGYDFGSMTPDVRDTSRGRQHGTMTSGIVLGDGSGGTITGVAPRARLVLL
jgi:subtilisin family serine protease